MTRVKLYKGALCHCYVVAPRMAMEETRPPVKSVAELEDAQGRRFWESAFGKRLDITWEAFINALFPFLELPVPRASDIKLRCLTAVLADIAACTVPTVITLDTFNRFLLWLAPLQPDVFQRLLELLVQPWFHGSLSSAAASDRVRDAGDGSFLVRFSAREPGAYAITCRTSEQIRHYRITRKAPGRYVLGQVEARSLHDMVQRFSTELKLLHACPGSHFQALLRKATNRYEEFCDEP